MINFVEPFTELNFGVIMKKIITTFSLVLVMGCVDNPYQASWLMNQTLSAERSFQSDWRGSYAPEQNLYSIREAWNNRRSCVVACNSYQFRGSGSFDECITGPKTNFFGNEPAVIVIMAANHHGKTLTASGSFQQMMSSALSQAVLGNVRHFNNKKLDTINGDVYVYQFHIDVRGRGNFSFYAGGEYLGSVSIVRR